MTTDELFTASHRGGAGSPLVLVHGFTDTWRTWELVLPTLERRHDVLAPTLAGHAGGPPITGEASTAAVADALEEAMDAAGFATAHLVGNSLGGYLALVLAARGRAETVVALAPAGGWMPGDESFRETLDHFARTQEAVRRVAPHAERFLATPEGRRRATVDTVVAYEHIPVDLLAHQMRGSAACQGAEALLENAGREGWPLDAAAVMCPVRLVWGTEDRLLRWPSAAEGYRQRFPHADWVVIDDVGHMPQLDVPAVTADLVLGFTG